MTFREVILTWRTRDSEADGHAWLAESVKTGAISNDVLRRVQRELEESCPRSDRGLLKWVEKQLAPHGRQPPEVGETRKYKAITRPGAVDAIRLPLHRIKTKRGHVDVTFEANRIVVSSSAS